jgi:hypothetical protein
LIEFEAPDIGALACSTAEAKLFFDGYFASGGRDFVL